MAASAKKDGAFGLGKGPGYGTLHHVRFETVFEQGVQDVVLIYRLPDRMEDVSIAFHLQQLKIAVFRRASALYQTAYSNKEDWTSKCQEYSVTNTFRKIIYGQFDGPILPAYVISVILNIQEPRWKKFLTISIIVKHNHQVVLKQRKKHAVYNRVGLMNLSAQIGEEHSPPDPYPSTVFDKISFVQDPPPPPPPPPPPQQVQPAPPQARPQPGRASSGKGKNPHLDAARKARIQARAANILSEDEGGEEGETQHKRRKSDKAGKAQRR